MPCLQNGNFPIFITFKFEFALDIERNSMDMYSLLIVDDEERVRRGLKNCIDWESYGFDRIYTAKNGKEGLATLIDMQPTLVLTDVVMPDMNGLEFIETARKMGYQNQFVVISGYANFDYARQAISLNVSGYILKPVREAQVIEQVEICLKKIKELKPEEEKTEQIDCENPLIKTAIEYIHEQYAKDITLNEVASFVALHPNYFSTLFTKHKKESFSKYLMRVRMEKACHLLQNPTIKVFETAKMVGYADYRQFSKQFKNFVGQTPVEYRNSKNNLK